MAEGNAFNKPFPDLPLSLSLGQFSVGSWGGGLDTGGREATREGT